MTKTMRRLEKPCICDWCDETDLKRRGATMTMKCTIQTHAEDVEELEEWRELNRRMARELCRVMMEKLVEIATKGGEEK